MKSAIYTTLMVSLIAGLTGCYTMNIVSNVKKDAQPEFKRILIVSNLPNTRPTYLPTFQTAFPAGYQVCAVANSPISFETPEEMIDKQRQICQSEVQLTIDLNRNYTSGSGKYISSNNEIYLEMKSLATGQPFWKALVPAWYGTEVSPQLIINQLIKDDIIQGPLPVGKSYQSPY